MKNRLQFILALLVSTLLLHCSSKSKTNSTSNANNNGEEQQTAGPIVEDALDLPPAPSTRVVPTVPTNSAQANSGKTPGANVEKPIYGSLNQLIKNQDADGILKEGSSLLMKNPNDVKALNAMAMAYYKRSQYLLAKSLLLRAMKVDARSYELHSNLGVVQLALGEKNDALKSFKKAIDLNPNDYVSASNAGSLYVGEQDFEKASVVLEIAYSKGYRNAKVLSNYALALTATGKYEKADKIYREALKDNGNDKGILFNHAILLIQFLKKNDEGLDLVKKLKFLGVPEEAKKRFQELQAMAERKSQ